ncbi:DUF3999 family protein [Rhodoferax sp.]|uniref:DUF3999 family protein n=1 Tax=Rhodoferax sp. TaxID=50421 RepID=UPI0025F5A667|nr:DUF3999 family protein [Rhodoferax sp.]
MSAPRLPRPWFRAPVLLALAGVLLAPSWAAAAEPVASEFAWRGAVTPADGASLVRVALPPDALSRLQSARADDVRVFNSAGTVVPFAVLAAADLVQTAPPVQTRAYPALGLVSTAPPQAASAAARVEVQVGQGADSTVVWVQPKGSTPTAAASAWPAVLLDLRTESQTLSALQLQGEWPRNTLVHLELASSDNLRDWVPVPVRGPVFRFEGADAPIQTALELAQPQSFRGRYLRLGWGTQTGVRLRSVTGQVAPARAAADRVRVDLGTSTPDGAVGHVWALPFATPVHAVHVQARQDNALLPVRMSGRADPAQPWRLLASSVVYRLDSVAGGRSNPAQEIASMSLGQLRLEPGSGLPLPAAELQVSVELAPVQLAFVASGSGPFVVAAGRSGTAPVAVDAATLASASATPLQALPLTAVRQLRADLPGAPQLWAASLLPAGVSLRSAMLWAVLLLGVGALAGVAYALLRQLNAGAPDSQKP